MGFLLSQPAPASAGVGSKQRDGIGGPPLPLSLSGIPESLLAQPGPQLLHLQMGMIHLACLCHGHMGEVANSTGQGGDLKDGCYAMEVSHLCVPILGSLDNSV